MSKIVEANINTSPLDKDLLEHIPKAFQAMARIDQMTQARFCEIMASIERGETTLKEVKRQRDISYANQDPVESSLTPIKRCPI